MKTRIIRVGNSRGVRIPKRLLEQTGLNGVVDMQATKNGIIISRPKKARAGWAQAARELADADEDKLLDDGGPTTEFDKEQWEW